MRTTKLAEASDEMNKDSDKKTNKKDKKQESSLISRLIGGDPDVKKEIVDQTLERMMVNQQTTQKLTKKVQKELEQCFQQKESTEDFVRISVSDLLPEDDINQTKKMEKKKEKQQEKESIQTEEHTKKNEIFTKGNLPNAQAKTLEEMKKSEDKKQVQERKEQSKYQEESKTLLKEFASSMTEHLVSNSPQQKQKMEDIKKQMMEQGVNTTTITKMEAKVSNMVRQHMVSTLRDKMLKHLFSKAKSSIEITQSGKELLSFFKTTIEGNTALGGEDFGNYTPQGALGVFANVRNDLLDEIKGFIMDETVETFVSHTVKKKSGKEFQEELSKLQKFCKDNHIPINNQILMVNIHKTIDRLGLAQFMPPTNPNQNFSFSEGDERGRDKKNEDSTIYLNQEDLLVDKLRSLYFQRAMNPGFKTAFELTFKIRKMKNNLFKLGIMNKDLEAQVNQEGQFLAKEQFLSDLYQIFLEQATLQKLKGPSYDILRNKQAFILKSLHKIGHRVKEAEMNKIRDNANQEMYPIIKERYHRLEIIADVQKSVQASRQRKMLLEILLRLKDESKIPDVINNSDDDGQNGFTNRSIVEAV